MKNLATACYAALWLLAAAVVHADARDDAPVTLNIAPQPLRSALKQLSQQAGVQVLLRVDNLSADTVMAPPLKGKLTIRAALDLLLANTGLSYEFVNSHTIRVSSAHKPVSGTTEPLPGLSSFAGVQAGVAEGGGDVQLQEVVVTATKRSERLQDTAMALTVVGRDDIQALGAKTLEDVARTVPGLLLSETGYGYTTPVIRGIVQGGGVATVGYYVDDTPVAAISTNAFVGNPAPELYDVDRVEVLRGPQGTLYGSSAMGGTIRFITPEAPLDAQSGRVTGGVSGGSGISAGYDVGAAYGTPIIDGTLGFRGSVYFRDTAGFVDRLSRATGDTVDSNVNTVRVGGVHLSMLWKVSDALTVTPGFLFQTRQNGDLPAFSSVFGPFAQNNVIGQPGHDNYGLPSLDVKYDFGPFSLTAVTSYFYRNQKQTFDYSTLVPSLFTGEPVAPGFINYLSAANRINDDRTFSEELRLMSPADRRLTWLVGAYFARLTNSLGFPLYEPQFPDFCAATPACAATFGGTPANLAGGLDSLVDNTVVDKEIAGFGEVSYQPVAGLTVTAALRYSQVRSSFTTSADGPLQGGSGATSGSALARPVSPKFALSYKLSAQQMVYLSATKGFRVGGANEPVPEATCQGDLQQINGGLQPKDYFNPDSVWSYEAGYKALLFERRVSLDASLYRINWTNIQQNITLPDCGFQYTANFGSARSQGVELELSATPVRGLTLRAEASYDDGKFTSNTFGPPALSGASVGQSAIYAMSGDKIPFTPAWTGSLSATYSATVTDSINAYARADFQYQGRYTRTAPSGEVGYDPLLYSAAGYGYGSARLGVVQGNWDISLFCNNLTNARPIIGKFDALTPATGISVATSLMPRIFGLTVDRKF